MIKGRGGGILRATHPRGLVVLAADLDDRRVVGVEVEVVPLDGAQDLLGQGVGRLALEDEGEVHHEQIPFGRSPNLTMERPLLVPILPMDLRTMVPWRPLPLNYSLLWRVDAASERRA